MARYSAKAGDGVAALLDRPRAPLFEMVVALRVHLDDSTSSNGPLRVLPGTHVRGVLTDCEIQQFANDIVPVDCLAQAGGVVGMRPLTVHASSKSRTDAPRRVLHIEYASSMTFGIGLELAVE